MLSLLEKKALDESFQLVMVNNTNKGLNGWRILMQTTMNEQGWNIDKQIEAIKYLGIN